MRHAATAALRAMAAGAALFGSVAYAAAEGDCNISPVSGGESVRFEGYPVAPTLGGQPVRPRLGTRDAAQYRTILRKGAATGPNFAGHFSLVHWGCGSSCTDFAIIDSANGQVHFLPHWRAISTVHVDVSADRPVTALAFRKDSRLVELLGAPNEDGQREGAYQLLWDGEQLKTLAFTPLSRACNGTGR